MSHHTPDTRLSLIARLADRKNAEAWEQFIDIYEPLVMRMARLRGLQDADAHEVTQEVLLAVSRAVENWRPEKGRFRDWLFGITRNLLVNFISRPKYRSIGSGDSRVAELLNNFTAPSTDRGSIFELEHRREVFHWAAGLVKSQTSEKAWQAFWQTSVLQRAIGEVAQEMEMSVGAVYIARSRILSKLRKVIADQRVDTADLSIGWQDER